MNVISVVRPLHIVVFFNYIEEHILDRNTINVISVIRPLQVIVFYNSIKNTF